MAKTEDLGEVRPSFKERRRSKQALVRSLLSTKNLRLLQAHNNQKPQRKCFHTQNFRLKRVLVVTAAGFIVVMALATVYHEWRKRFRVVYSLSPGW